MIVQTTVGRVVFNDILHPQMPFYNLTLGQKQLQGIIADCYQILGRRETIALLDRMKDLGSANRPARACRSPPTTSRRPPTKDAIIAEAEKEVAKQQQALPARDHHRPGAVQQGARRLDPRPRADHGRDDGSPAQRHPRGRGLPEPDLPDGRVGCPRRRRADPPAGRHARTDGQALGQDHRDADQGQLPRRAVGARVLQLDPRCPQGPGRHGPQDGRQRLPDPQAGRRRPERRDHHGRLRHLAGHHQGRHLQGREGRGQPRPVDPRPGQPGQHRRPDHRRGRRQGKRDDHPGRGQEARGDADREDPGPQPDDLRGVPGRLPALLRHGPGHRPARRGGHGRRHHRRPVDRRARHPAHHADLPHRRRRHPRRRGEGRQGQARRQGQVRRHQHRDQRRRQADRPVAQRRDPDPRPQGSRAREVRRARRRDR